MHDFVPFDTGYLYVYDFSNDVKTDSYAVYSHWDFKLTDQWGLTAGGRYSDERKKFLGGQADLDGFNYKISGCLDPNANAQTFLRPRCPAHHLPAVAGIPGRRAAAALLPEHWDHQDWNVFTPTAGDAVPDHPGHDGLLQLLEGLQVGRLDHTSVQPDLEPRHGPV